MTSEATWRSIAGLSGHPRPWSPQLELQHRPSRQTDAANRRASSADSCGSSTSLRSRIACISCQRCPPPTNPFSAEHNYRHSATASEKRLGVMQSMSVAPPTTYQSIPTAAAISDARSNGLGPVAHEVRRCPRGANHLTVKRRHPPRPSAASRRASRVLVSDSGRIQRSISGG